MEHETISQLSLPKPGELRNSLVHPGHQYLYRQMCAGKKAEDVLADPHLQELGVHITSVDTIKSMYAKVKYQARYHYRGHPLVQIFFQGTSPYQIMSGVLINRLGDEKICQILGLSKESYDGQYQAAKTLMLSFLALPAIDRCIVPGLERDLIDIFWNVRENSENKNTYDVLKKPDFDELRELFPYSNFQQLVKHSLIKIAAVQNSDRENTPIIKALL